MSIIFLSPFQLLLSRPSLSYFWKTNKNEFLKNPCKSPQEVISFTSSLIYNLSVLSTMYKKCSELCMRIPKGHYFWNFYKQNIFPLKVSWILKNPVKISPKFKKHRNVQNLHIFPVKFGLALKGSLTFKQMYPSYGPLFCVCVCLLALCALNFIWSWGLKSWKEPGPQTAFFPFRIVSKSHYFP